MAYIYYKRYALVLASVFVQIFVFNVNLQITRFFNLDWKICSYFGLRKTSTKEHLWLFSVRSCCSWVSARSNDNVFIVSNTVHVQLRVSSTDDIRCFSNGFPRSSNHQQWTGFMEWKLFQDWSFVSHLVERAVERKVTHVFGLLITTENEWCYCVLQTVLCITSVRHQVSRLLDRPQKRFCVAYRKKNRVTSLIVPAIILQQRWTTCRVLSHPVVIQVNEILCLHPMSFAAAKLPRLQAYYSPHLYDLQHLLATFLLIETIGYAERLPWALSTCRLRQHLPSRLTVIQYYYQIPIPLRVVTGMHLFRRTWKKMFEIQRFFGTSVMTAR